MAEPSSTETLPPVDSGPATSDPAPVESTAPSLNPASFQTQRWKNITSMVLLITFFLCSALAVPSVWARNQITKTDRYVRTVTPLASDPAVQNAIATRISTGLTEPIVSLTADVLPGNQRLLTGPISTAMEGFVYDTVLEAVQSDQFQTFWEDANRAIHSQVNNLLAGKTTGIVQRSNGQLIIDLTPIYQDVENRLQARGIDLSGRVQLDPSKTSFVIFESPKLAKAHTTINSLERAAIILPIVALIALAGYLLLARRKRSAVIAAGLGFAVTMAILLIVLALARWRYMEGLSPDRDPVAAAAFFDILVKYLRDAVRLLGLLGLIVVAIAYVTKPGGRVAHAGRSAGAWLSSGWDDVAAKWPWLDSAAAGLARHRRELLAGLLGLCCLILILRGRLTLEFAVIVAVIAVVGLLLIRLLSRVASSHRQPPQAAIEWSQPATMEATEVPASEVVPASAARPEEAKPLELSEEDAQMLRRLAALLREVPPEPASS